MSATTPQRPRGRIDPRIAARRKAVRAADARRRRRVTLSLAALVVIALLAVAVSRSPLFSVSGVVVEGVGGERAAAVRAAADVAAGTNLLDVDLGQVAQRVQALPWVAEAEVERRPPSTVAVTVTGRLPAAVVRLDGAAWLVDRDGVVLAGGTEPAFDAPSSPAGLPVIEAPNSVLPGVGVEARDAAVRNALAVLDALPVDLRARADRYQAPSERGLRLHLRVDGAPDGVWVDFGAAERVDDKARVIDALIATARDQAQRAGDETIGVDSIDVRAPDNPVLVPTD